MKASWTLSNRALSYAETPSRPIPSTACISWLTHNRIDCLRGYHLAAIRGLWFLVGNQLFLTGVKARKIEISLEWAKPSGWKIVLPLSVIRRVAAAITVADGTLSISIGNTNAHRRDAIPGIHAARPVAGETWKRENGKKFDGPGARGFASARGAGAWRLIGKKRTARASPLRGSDLEFPPCSTSPGRPPFARSLDDHRGDVSQRGHPRGWPSTRDRPSLVPVGIPNPRSSEHRVQDKSPFLFAPRSEPDPIRRATIPLRSAAGLKTPPRGSARPGCPRCPKVVDPLSSFRVHARRSRDWAGRDDKLAGR